jgi:hypothetical protein
MKYGYNYHRQPGTIKHDSCVNTFRNLIDLQSLLRHFSFTQKVQRHPDQMPLDPIQLLPNLLG